MNSRLTKLISGSKYFLLLALVAMIPGCFSWAEINVTPVGTVESNIVQNPADTDIGYVKFYRPDDEDHQAKFRIYRRLYGQEVHLGNIEKSQDAFCIPLPAILNTIKVYAPGGKTSLRLVNVKKDKVHPVEIVVSWSKGRTFDKISFFRWNVFVKKRREPEQDGECGLKVEPVEEPSEEDESTTEVEEASEQEETKAEGEQAKEE